MQEAYFWRNFIYHEHLIVDGTPVAKEKLIKHTSIFLIISFYNAIFDT